MDSPSLNRSMEVVYGPNKINNGALMQDFANPKFPYDVIT